MPDFLRTNIGQFNSTDGHWQPRAANVRAVEPAAELPGAQRGSLYMLVEVHGAGGGHPALYRQMLNAAQTAFYEMGDTVESALRQAVRNVHMVLRRANEGLPEAGWSGGISLAVRYADQLVIAQAGPALALVSHPRTVDQFPAELGDWGPPLGSDLRPEVQIFDATVEAGSMLLLAQSDWPDHVTPEALAVAAATPDVALASQYLSQLAGNADLSALLISFARDIPELREEPQKPLIAAAPERPSAEAAPAGAKPAGKGLLGGAGRLLGRSRSEEQPIEPIEARPAPVERVTGPASASAAAAESQARPEVGPASRSYFQPEVEPPPAARTPWPEQEWTQEPVAEETALPPRQARSRWWLLLAFVAIPLLIGGIVLAMLFGRNRAVEAQFVEKLDGATSVIAQVETMTDDAAALQRLGQAQDFLDQARMLLPDDARLASVETRYEENLARLQSVIFLYGGVPLWNFDKENRSWQRVLISGDALFVLDRGQMEVYRFTLSALGDTVSITEKPVIRKGDQVGDLIIGDLVDIAWVEAEGANQRSKLLAVDNAGGLIGYDVTWGQENLALAGREKWVQPKLAAGYGGNLYVADVGAGQIWRHRSADSGYGDSEPYFGTTTVNLVGLRDMAIDGNIWLLFDDGRLLKFFNGEQRPFIWRGLPDPISAPAAVAVSQESDRVYVADAGNARIIEATKDGEFLRQFRVREGDILRNLRSFFLDEASSVLYILTDSGLLKIDIPAEEVVQGS